MLELWDYLVQFLVTAYGFCAALREYYRARRRPWFLLTCFYATFALGTLYWSLHLLLRQETPQVFYVSDLAWLASFATFENVCYLTQNGAGQFVYLLIRGFGTGAMHIVCGSVYGRVLRPVWGSRPLRAACLFGLLCVAIIYHAIYNLLVSVGGTAQLIAYAIPPAHGAVLPPARAADRSAKATRSSDGPHSKWMRTIFLSKIFQLVPWINWRDFQRLRPVKRR